MLSVIIPIKDERPSLFALHQQLREALDALDSEYEIIFVDDGSIDGSFSILQGIAAADPTVKLIRFRRNYGQTAALHAGIDHARGDILVTLDGDLQNDPCDIPALLEKVHEGYDIVLGCRQKRHDNWLLRRLPSWLGNQIIRRLTGVRFLDFGCTIRVMRRDLAESLPLYGEMHRFIPALAQQLGAQIAQIPVRHHRRKAGRSKYGLSRAFRVVLDLLTVLFLGRFLSRPMHLFGGIGLSLMLCGLASLFATVYMRFADGLHMTRNPLLLLTVMLELCGVQFLSTGLLGELLARTYFESQGKPPYRIREIWNFASSELADHSARETNRELV
ncbi:MAG TPA: glycosyltransferase family 2 protein [Gemmataceae bacterium]|jgi:glycosyltransferase involved in cell wall biosynthesis|nr:glycosyltransferase family 2 protein [Gemmataceae bacterium]